LEEIGALRARLVARTDEVRALKADIAARDVLIARLRAGEDPVGVHPSCRPHSPGRRTLARGPRRLARRPFRPFPTAASRAA
jgi:hypothetical protein